MANRNEKNPANAPGLFYVDTTCIDCDMCRETVPGVFRRDDELGATIVFRQPATSEETQETQEALDHCPTGSIGNDG